MSVINKVFRGYKTRKVLDDIKIIMEEKDM